MPPAGRRRRMTRRSPATVTTVTTLATRHLPLATRHLPLVTRQNPLSLTIILN
jgi:hypothetical protein